MRFITSPLFILFALCPALFAAQPNVLFIIVDDLTTTLGCYGNPSVRTPGMDALAARGVRFDRAYTQFALCNPSRCSFLTGCYPEKTGVMDLSTSLRKALPDVVTLPQHFKDHGYATGRVGKVFHMPDPKTKLDAELGSALHKDNEILVEAKTANDPDDKPRSKAKGEGYNRTYAASARPAADFTDYAIADDAIATLEEFKAKPFFLAVGFIRPHTPFVAPKSFFEAIDATQLTLPPFYREGGEDLSQLPKASLRPTTTFSATRLPDAMRPVMRCMPIWPPRASWTRKSPACSKSSANCISTKTPSSYSPAITATNSANTACGPNKRFLKAQIMCRSSSPRPV
jgi:iduronate 2-sulfatase